MAPEEARLPAERVERDEALCRAAATGDADTCKLLLSPDEPNGGTDADWDGAADVWYAQEDALAWDALHYAADGGHDAVVRLLLRHGALWNGVDAMGLTAADVAWSRNHTRCYQILFEEGVRRTFVANTLLRKVQGGSGEQEPGAAAASEKQGDAGGPQAQVSQGPTGTSVTLAPGTNQEVAASNEAFLKSRLRFVQDEAARWRCLDQDDNMVMAEWEDDIMRHSAAALCEGQQPGFSVLNVGFGLGIIDEFFQQYSPGRHVIIEPHPDALAFMRERGWAERPGVEIFEGTWEQFMRTDDVATLTRLGSFDAVYFDTYSQDYGDLRAFFECLPNILSGPEARFSFFHGLAATNAFLYDVYTRVSELDLREIGLVTHWRTLEPRVDEDTWRGVKRRYWTLDRYHLPVCHMQLV